MPRVRLDADIRWMVPLLDEATRGMKEAVEHSGSYRRPLIGQSFPRAQIVTVNELLNFKRPQMPTPFPPFTAARRRVAATPQDVLFEA